MSPPLPHKPATVDEIVGLRDEVYFNSVLLNCKRLADVKTDEVFEDQNQQPTVTYDKDNQNILTIRAPSGAEKTFERIAAVLPDENDTLLQKLFSSNISRWGFKASAFAELDDDKKANGTVQLVFPGVWQSQDILAAAATGSGLITNPQVKQVEKFSQYLNDTLKEKDITLEQANIVGHSLGTQNALAMHRRMLTGNGATQMPNKNVHTTLIDAYGARVGLRNEAANMVKDKAEKNNPLAHHTETALDKMISVVRQTVVQLSKAAQLATDKVATVFPPAKALSAMLEKLEPQESVRVRTKVFREALNITRNITSISANSFLKEYPDGLTSSRENSEEAIGARAFRLIPSSTPHTPEQERYQKATLHGTNYIGSEMYKNSQLLDQHAPNIPEQMRAPKIKDIINLEKQFLPAMWAKVAIRTIEEFSNNFKHQFHRTDDANKKVIKEYELKLDGIDLALAAVDSTKKILEDTIRQNLGSYEKEATPSNFIADKARESDQTYLDDLKKMLEKNPITINLASNTEAKANKRNFVDQLQPSPNNIAAILNGQDKANDEQNRSL